MYSHPMQPQPRTRLQVEERRQQLLTLGLSLFGDRTYEEISIDDIASAANVSKGLLYHYFPSKRAYYVAAVRMAAEQLISETEPTDTGGPPTLSRLREGLHRFLTYVGKHGKAYSFLMRGGVGADPEVLEIIESTRQAFLTRTVHQMGASPDDPRARILLRGWIGFVEAVSMDWAADKPMSVDELCDMLIGISGQMLGAALKSR